MRLLFSELIHLLTKKQERNTFLLVKFIVFLAVLVTFYSILFHFIMILENREFSWITGFYWTLTVMSTLGFGDITFTTDIGKLFSIVVLMSGILLLLTMLPFTFIQFFYLPWVEAQAKAKAPRRLPKGARDHVIFTGYDPVVASLAESFGQYGRDYVVVVEDAQKALDLQDIDIRAAVGELGDPQTYRQLRVEDAALVVADVDDMMNTNIAFTVREITKRVPIVANADSDDSVDILELSGCTYVFQFTKMLGQSLARRVLGATTKANVIGEFESLQIAEAAAMRTSLVGKTLQESKLRETVGVNVVGVWERGLFVTATAKTPVNPTTVLLLAGTAEQISAYDKKFGTDSKQQAPVLILGGGRVGQSAGQALESKGIDYRIIEKEHGIKGDDRYIYGSAADLNILMQAGIKEAPSIIITTHDDPTNIYLTIYCRRLCPDVQIISRANLERSISKLHTAGADLVMSQTSMVASTIINLLRPDELLMIAEGLNVFRVGVPASFVGKSLAESDIRARTGCSVIAVYDQELESINPEPSIRFSENSELILIGNAESERRFLKLFVDPDRIRAKSSRGSKSHNGSR